MVSHLQISERIVEHDEQRLLRDIHLSREALAGNRPAFEQLYRECVDHLYAVCLRMLADKDQAGELVQQTIIKAWQTLYTYRGECPFEAWIHRIAVNTVLDYLRSRHRLESRVRFSRNLEPYETGNDFVHPGTAFDLEQAIQALPAQARAVLILHDIEGYKHEEISEMMGISTGTTKSQLHRARMLMKEMLES